METGLAIIAKLVDGRVVVEYKSFGNGITNQENAMLIASIRVGAIILADECARNTGENPRNMRAAIAGIEAISMPEISSSMVQVEPQPTSPPRSS